MLTEQLVAERSCFEARLGHLRVFIHNTNIPLEGYNNWFVVM
jgi:hypothetical protein